MGICKYIDGLPIVDGMTRVWGDNLEELNLSEKLWLVRAALGSYCDFDLANRTGLDAAIVEAENALLHLNQEFYLRVTYSFSQYLTEESKPLGYYLSSTDEAEQEWIKNVAETWGNYLESIPENDGLIFLFNASTQLIDFHNLPNIEAMHEWFEAFEDLDHSNGHTLIAALATVTHDSYFEARYQNSKG